MWTLTIWKSYFVVYHFKTPGIQRRRWWVETVTRFRRCLLYIYLLEPTKVFLSADNPKPNDWELNLRVKTFVPDPLVVVVVMDTWTISMSYNSGKSMTNEISDLVQRVWSRMYPEWTPRTLSCLRLYRPDLWYDRNPSVTILDQSQGTPQALDNPLWRYICLLKLCLIIYDIASIEVVSSWCFLLHRLR